MDLDKIASIDDLHISVSPSHVQFFVWSTEIEANRKIIWWGMGGVLLNKAYLTGEEEKLNFCIIRDMKM